MLRTQESSFRPKNGLELPHAPEGSKSEPRKETFDAGHNGWPDVRTIVLALEEDLSTRLVETIRFDSKS
jgi:hypothetical protein